MTFASFLLVSALSAAADAPVAAPAGGAAPVVSAPAAAPVVSAPVVSAPGGGCCNTPAPADCGCGNGHKQSRGGLFSGLFSRKQKAEDCGCAPAPCAAPAPAPVKHADCCVPAPCDPCAGNKHSRPSFFGSFFGGRKKEAHSDCGCGSAAVAPAAPVYHGSPVITPVPATNPAPIQKLPADSGKKVGALPTAPVIAPTAAKTQTGPSNPFDQGRRDVVRVAHAADAGSITGKLTYVHADGGLWVLRYASLDTEDANGGSVILSRDGRLSDYRDGDVVRVQGRITDQRGSTRLGAPLYRVSGITLVERP